MEEFKTWINTNKKKIIFYFSIFIAFLICFLYWKSWYLLVIISVVVFAIASIIVWLDPFPTLTEKIFKKGKEGEYPLGKRLKDAGLLGGIFIAIFTLGVYAFNNEINQKNHLDDRFRDGTISLEDGAFSVKLSGISILKEVVNEAKNKGGEIEKKYIDNVYKVLCIFMQEYTLNQKNENESEDMKRRFIFGKVIEILAISQPKDSLDLSNCNLGDLDLRELGKKSLRKANLKNANLTNADLRWTDLTDADLTGANLSSETKLKGVKFNKETKLKEVNFSYTNLSNVNFNGADLSYANFKKANICGTNFANTKLYYADFSNINLDDVNQETNFKDAKMGNAKISRRILGAKDINTNKAIVVEK